MFNFKCLNKALLDETLDDNEFRTLYFIANSIALSGEDEIEMYNDYIAKKMNITVREVQYRTSSLEKKGYISKRQIRKGNKKPNIIKLNEQTFIDTTESQRTETSKLNEQTFTLYNSTEDKNTSTGTKPNKIKVSAKSCTLNKSTLNTSRSMETENKLTKAEVTKRNDFITSTYRKLEQRLNYLYTVKTHYVFNALTQEISDIFKDAQEKEDWFTEAQWEKLCKYADRWTKIDQAKQDYLSNVKKENLFEEDEEYLQYKQEIENLTAGVSLVNV